ncbi:MAG: hypothetical protein LBI89_02405 [Prevotellaceae bacterium]|jgi:hypothetical protein|nr:hypothetical protein [Prevotellaceae bacterium]
MKKHLFFFSLLVPFCVAANAQTAGNDATGVHADNVAPIDIRAVNFYGIDFSLASAPDVKEHPRQFKNGIVRINDLLYREVLKYDFKKYTGLEILAYNFDVTGASNDSTDARLLTSRNRRREISEADIQKIVASLSTGNDGRFGLVFIAETLSKASRSGTYRVVCFDEATKQIIYARKVTGKAGGFGVRNFWAASVLDVLKKWNRR